MEGWVLKGDLIMTREMDVRFSIRIFVEVRVAERLRLFLGV